MVERDKPEESCRMTKSSQFYTTNDRTNSKVKSNWLICKVAFFVYLDVDTSVNSDIIYEIEKEKTFTCPIIVLLFFALNWF